MTTNKLMTLEQAIAYLHPHVNSSHNTDWKTKREAWDVLMAHLAPREVSDELQGDFAECYISTTGLETLRTPGAGIATVGRVKTNYSHIPLFLNPRVTPAEVERDAARWRQFVEMIDPDKVPGGFTVYYAVEKGTDQLCYFDCVTELVDAALAKL